MQIPWRSDRLSGDEPQCVNKENVGETERKVLVASGVCPLPGWGIMETERSALWVMVGRSGKMRTEVRPWTDSETGLCHSHHFWLHALFISPWILLISVAVVGFQSQQSFKVHLDDFPGWGQTANKNWLFLLQFLDYLLITSINMLLPSFFSIALAIHVKVIATLPYQQSDFWISISLLLKARMPVIFFSTIWMKRKWD